MVRPISASTGKQFYGKHRSVCGTMIDDRAPFENPGETAERQVRLGPIIRDILIVWILTLMGGFVIGIATGEASAGTVGQMLALAASNILFGTVAFAIVGCLAPPPRWRHLALVAAGTWFTGLVNVVFFGVTFLQWIGGAVFIVAIMGLGGTISYAFKK